MSEWKTYRLGDIIQLKSGGTPDKSNPDYWGGSIPWISAKSMYDDFISTSDLFITEEGLQAGSKIAKKDSILLLTRGSGLFNRIPVCYVVSDVAYNQDVKNIVLKKEDVTSIKFLYYWLYGNKELLSSMLETTGIGAGKIDTKRFLNLSISLPSQKEQARYIHLMNLLFDKIELNRRINANLEAQAQALFRSWFVDFEPFRDGPFVDSELGKIPQGWKVGTASEFYKNITIGKTPPRKEHQWFSKNSHDIVWVSIADMGNCGLSICNSSEYLTPEAIKKFNICIVPVNTVLLSFKLTIGRVAIADKELATNEAIAHFQTQHNTLEYTYLALKNYEFSSLGSTSSIATAVNSKIIKSMPWMMPSDDVLNQFHNVLSPIFNGIRNNIQEITRLSALRDTLLPKLMAGELNLE